MCGKYRVLTPTMYRSRMAATRQALSMDCEASSSYNATSARHRREGPSLRVPLPFQRPLQPKAQDSLELELGASATGVHNFNNSPKKILGQMGNVAGATAALGGLKALKKDSEESDVDNSMQLDLHVEGCGPVTLLVRDESRSTRSTSGNRDSNTTRSHSKSPKQSPLRELLSVEKEEETLVKRDSLKVTEETRRKRHSFRMTRRNKNKNNDQVNKPEVIKPRPRALSESDLRPRVKRSSFKKSLAMQKMEADVQRTVDVVGGAGCGVSSPRPSCPGISQSLTTVIASLSFIDDESDVESMRQSPKADVEEELEEELFLEIANDDLMDESEAFPIVYSVKQSSMHSVECFEDDFVVAGSSESSSLSSSSKSNSKRHQLKRQSKMEDEV